MGHRLNEGMKRRVLFEKDPFDAIRILFVVGTPDFEFREINHPIALLLYWDTKMVIFVFHGLPKGCHTGNQRTFQQAWLLAYRRR